MKKHFLILILILPFIGVLKAQNTSSNNLLFDFKNENIKSEFVATNSTAVQTAEGLKITIQPNEDGLITFNGNWKLSDWVYLTLELINTENETIRFDPIISGEFKSKRPSKPLWTIGYLKPLETRIYNCILLPDYSTRKITYKELDARFSTMRGMPDGISFTHSFDLDLTKKIQIKFPASTKKREIILVSIITNKPSVSELYKKNPEKFFPFIDEYGQYIHGNWAGKILSDNQLKADLKTEENDLNANKGSKEWSKYGGYKNGPKLEATGHFRTEKMNGKWWIVDPDGFLFWSVGINSACKLNVPTPVNGREYFFQDLPDKNDTKFGKFYIKNEYDFGLANMQRKYGTSNPIKYAEYGLKRMRSWGFNTLGGWGYEEVSDFTVEKRIPYTVSIWTLTPLLTDKFPDVFDPNWRKNVSSFIKSKAEMVKNDPFFIGYFVDNEMHWFDPNGMATYIIKNQPNSAGKKHYVELLKMHLKDITVFNEKTGTDFSDWDALLKSTKKIELKNIEEINILFYNELSEIYFKTIRNIIDEFSPGNLFIGCRWHVPANHRNKYNVTIGAKYLDIISFNQYDNEITENTFEELQHIDKPFIVSEFNFGALDRGKFYPGLNYASDQRNRGEKYANFIQSALRNPKCVGAHWFMWANSTTAGRSVVGENANCGIVSETDQPYYELINGMREINYNLYKYALTK
jgi:hypothetical protein